MIEANWLIFVAALLVGLIVAYLVFGRRSKPVKREHRPDVLDEGAAPAQRNQALIDQAPAAQFQLDPPKIPTPLAAKPQPELVPVQPKVETPVAPKVEAAPVVATQPAPEPVVTPEAPVVPEVSTPAQPVEPEAPQTIAAEPDPTPAAPAAPVLETADGEVQADDLRKIKGLGPKILTVLHALGVTTYAQIAAWTDEDLDQLDTHLGAFAGRPRRDSWVEQASFLATGDVSAYEAKFGKL